MSLLLANFIHARDCKLKCEKFLTLPYANILNRNFHADAPKCKWVTDISYIQTKQGVLYLSMIRDLYDNSIVAYKTATQ